MLFSIDIRQELTTQEVNIEKHKLISKIKCRSQVKNMKQKFGCFVCFLDTNSQAANRLTRRIYGE